MGDEHRDPNAKRITFDDMTRRAQYEWQRAEDAEAEAKALHERIEALEAENAALSEQALADRRRANDALNDATLWQHSMAMGDHDGQPLLVLAWKQRNEFRARLAAEVAHADRLADGLFGIRVYASDTLSGPSEGKADVAWYVEGVTEIQTRALAALAAHDARRKP